LRGGGFDSAMYFLNRGDNVRITDIRSRDSIGEGLDYLEKKGAVIHCSGHLTDDFSWSDLVIKSPSIRLDNEFLAFAKHGENDLTYAYSRPEVKQIKIICVTGARYKTTTASAICHALNEMGHKAHMCGNMGISAFSELQKWDRGDVPEYLIIEMSTWLARDTYHYLKRNVPHVEVSVITSVFDSQDENDEAAGRIGEFNLHANYIICPAEVKDAIGKIAAKKAKNISSIEGASWAMSKALPEKMRRPYAVLKKLGFSSSQINAALKSFKGIPCRCELVLRTENAMYINDSSSVIPVAVNFTADNYESLPVHLICGGSDASLDASAMLPSLLKAASLTLLDGTFTRKKLIPLLRDNKLKFNGPFEKMEEALSSASSGLSKNTNIIQVVLLSPGASAFEFFGNEFARGEAFTDAISRLAR
ncbi:MAG: UDP-N-acetylmuramoylalanine--D-glutamate ligase, partial [Spirochaetales bacterium]|nr:UDP-N-acetylmuramoylalanine--D-glutamate ligase [Spirochaetales bacterium]